MPKIGDAVTYDPGENERSVLAFCTHDHGGGTINLLWCDLNGAWHPVNSVPRRDEGGGVTWKPL